MLGPQDAADALRLQDKLHMRGDGFGF